MIFEYAMRSSKSLMATFYDYLLIRGKSSYLKLHLLINVRQAELFQEAVVFTPEEADVRDVIKYHGQSL